MKLSLINSDEVALEAIYNHPLIKYGLTPLPTELELNSNRYIVTQNDNQNYIPFFSLEVKDQARSTWSLPTLAFEKLGLELSGVGDLKMQSIGHVRRRLEVFNAYKFCFLIDENLINYFCNFFSDYKINGIQLSKYIFLLDDLTPTLKIETGMLEISSSNSVQYVDIGIDGNYINISFADFFKVMDKYFQEEKEEIINLICPSLIPVWNEF